jgi:hypothetical protein
MPFLEGSKITTIRILPNEQLQGLIFTIEFLVIHIVAMAYLNRYKMASSNNRTLIDINI